MIAVLQRVSRASVEVGGETVGSIGKGIVVLLCAVQGDTDRDVDYCVRKVSALRVFEDEQGRMNRSVAEAAGEVLVVPQFTLAADTRRGNRPSFDRAESPDRARIRCDEFVHRLRRTGVPVKTGVFAARMDVSLVNQGPVTVLVDSREGAAPV